MKTRIGPEPNTGVDGWPYVICDVDRFPVGRPYVLSGGRVMARSGAAICSTCKQVHYRTERWVEWPDGRKKRLKAYDGGCGCSANARLDRQEEAR